MAVAFESLFKNEFCPGKTVEILKIKEKNYVNIRKLSQNGKPLRAGACLNAGEYKEIMDALSSGTNTSTEEPKRKVSIEWKKDICFIKLEKKGYKTQEINLKKSEVDALINALKEAPEDLF